MNGNKLKYLRECKDLKQEQLGKILNISASAIGMYEQGRRQPDNDTLKKIANYFSVSTDYLLDNTPNIKSELEEKELLKSILIKHGYMKNSEDLTTNEYNRLIEFVINNKKYFN